MKEGNKLLIVRGRPILVDAVLDVARPILSSRQVSPLILNHQAPPRVVRTPEPGPCGRGQCKPERNCRQVANTEHWRWRHR